MAEPLQSKIGFGPRDSLAEAIEASRLDAYDIVCLDSQEIGWIAADGKTPIISKARLQEPIKVNGVSGLGIEDGKEIPAGKSLDEIIRMLVQKAIPATYTAPSVELIAEGTAPGDYEVGTILESAFKAEFAQNDSKGLISFKIEGPDGNIAEGASDNLTTSRQTIKILEGLRTFSAIAEYQEAVVKQNNFDEDSLENWFEAGTASSSVAYNGCWNTFYDAGAGNLPEVSPTNVRELKNKKLKATEGFVFDIILNQGSQWAMFAYPANLRDVQQIMYVETNDINMAPNFNKTLIDVPGANGIGSKQYKVYTWSMASPADVNMTFRVTI